jgi:hypothetical protein
LIRTAPLGIVLLCYFYFTSILLIGSTLSLVSLAPSFQSLSAVFAGCYLVGFLVDSLGMYKVHPVYRAVRREFFVSLYDQSHTALKDIGSLNERQLRLEKIRLAEQIREDALYKLESARYKNMRIEHAIWVLLYNISSITTIYSLIILALAAFGLADVIICTISGSVLFCFAGATLLSARARNISYGEKVKHVANRKKLPRSRATEK